MVSLPEDVENVKEPGVIAFDIGGTWFRSGIVSLSQNVAHVSRQPAINYRNTPHRHAHELQQALVNYLIQEAMRLRPFLVSRAKPIVAIALGACLNAHTGYVLNSGPLWGPDDAPFDLLQGLNQRVPDFTWLVCNDITALLLQQIEARKGEFNGSRVALITVSTGIGSRTYDLSQHRVPLDRLYGTQGEIGHIPISFVYNEQQFHLPCDCGGKDHLNAFCSGRGIEQTLLLLARQFPHAFQKSLLGSYAVQMSENSSIAHFQRALHAGDEFAQSILEAVTLPLAQSILLMLTIDVEIEHIFLVGGVVRGLGKAYLDSLFSHLEQAGLYQISHYEPDVFRKRIHPELTDEYAGLFGAALAARQLIERGE